jgi:hypothetical protein
MKRDIHGAQCAANDAAKYLAMAWMKELTSEAQGQQLCDPGWTFRLAVERLTEAAHALGFVLVPTRAEAPAAAPATEEAA